MEDKKMSKWIKCNDKLPKNEEFVLVLLEEGSKAPAGITTIRTVEPAMFIDNNATECHVDDLWYPHFMSYSDSIDWTKEVIAWVPFPEPIIDD